MSADTSAALLEPGARKASRAAPRQRALRAMASLLGLVVGGILIGSLAMLFGLKGDRLLMFNLALVTILVAAIPLIADQVRPPSRRHSVFSLFAIVFMFSYAAPVFTNYLPAGPFAKPGNIAPPLPLTPRDTVAGQEVALLALVCMISAYALPVGYWIGRSLPSLRRDWTDVECQIVAVGMLAIGGTIFSLGLLGLIPANLGSGVISALASFFIYSTVVLTYAYTRYGSPTALLMLIVTVPISSLLGFFSGSKNRTVIALVLIVLTRMFYSGRLRFRWIALGLLGLALFYPTAVFFRHVILADNTLPMTVPLSDPVGTLHRVEHFVSSQKIGPTLALGMAQTGARLDALGVTSVIVRDTPKVSPFQDGRTLALFFYSFVPRVLWPGKPNIDIGQWVTDTYGPGPGLDTKTGASICGDLYLNFGLWGVAGGFLVFGLLLRTFHEGVLARTRTAPAILLSSVLSIQLLTMLTGNVSTKAANMIFGIVPFLFIHLLVVTIFARSRQS